MSFRAYINNIQVKTGRSPDDFRRLAEEKGFAQNGTLTTGIKIGALINWLKTDFGLGHGHAMAIVALLKGKNFENDG